MKKIIIFLFCLLPVAVTAQITGFYASPTPSTCANNGKIEIIVMGTPQPTIYGIGKAPYDETKIVSQSAALFTDLEPGEYFFGYYTGTTFVKAEWTTTVYNDYSTSSPSFTTASPTYYAYCGTTDPLGKISGRVIGGNKPYTIALLDNSGAVLQEIEANDYGGVEFTGFVAGTYRLRATDACNTVVYTPEDIVLKPNVQYTDFTIGTPSPSPAEYWFEVEYNTPGDICSGIKKANLKNPLMALGGSSSSSNMVQDVTTTGFGAPSFYGTKVITYKVEIQNESGTFDVYDDLDYDAVYEGVYLLPTDRSKWGIIKLTFKICGIEKTNSIDLSTYSAFIPQPVAGKIISIRDNPANTSCPGGMGKVEASFDSMSDYPTVRGCYPFIMEVTEHGSSYTFRDTVTQEKRMGIVLLDIGKSYTFKIVDAGGNELTYYSFRNYTSSSSAPSQSNPANVYINPAHYTPSPIKNKLTFVEGPSLNHIGKSALVIQGMYNSMGLVSPVTITSTEGPSTINETVDLDGSIYYTGLGDNLLQGTYKIKVKDSGCFEQEYTVVLGSYISSIVLQNVTYTESSTVCDRYIISGEIKITAVGTRIVQNGPIQSVYGYLTAYPRLVSGPTGIESFYASGVTGKWFNVFGNDILPFTFTANISGNYHVGLSREDGYSKFLAPEDILETSSIVQLRVLPNFPAFDLRLSGGAICGGATTGDLFLKVDNVIGAVTYFIKKNTETDFPTTGQTNPLFTGLTAGTYDVKAVTRCYEVVQSFVMATQSATNIIVGDKELCEGSSLNFSTIPLGPRSSTEWTLPNGTTSNAFRLQIDNLTTAESGDYSVTIVTVTGCTFIQTVTVVVNPKAVDGAINVTATKL